MKLVNFEGKDVYLIPYRANRKESLTATPSFLTVEQRGLNGDEARRAYDDLSRTSTSFSLLLDGADAREFRAALLELKDKRVLCPFWPGQGSGVFQTGIWMTCEPDLSAYEVHTNANPAGAFSANAFRVPLMLGYLKSAPDPRAASGDALTASIDFVEDGPANYALLSTAADSGAGSIALDTGVTPKLFPFVPNWSTSPTAGGATVELKRVQIGFRREQAVAFYDQTAARRLTVNFTETSLDDIAALWKFFASRKGTVENFWLPGVFNECKLTEATGAAIVHVDDTTKLNGQRFISFIARNGTVDVRRVDAVNSGTQLHLDRAPAVAFQPGDTRITVAALCRFQKPELQFSFAGNRAASASISFIETPNEYELRGGETTGVTTGALKKRTYAYRFLLQMPGGTVYYRFTNHSRNVTIGAEVFTVSDFEHKEINNSLSPEDTTVSLKSSAFTGNPLLLMNPNVLEVPLMVQCLRCEPDANGIAATAKVEFFGRVKKPELSGATEITADAVSILQLINRNIPRIRSQKGCNYSVYTDPCGVSREAFKRSSALVAQNGNYLTLSGLSGAAVAVSYFKGGKVWFGTGGLYQGRTILDSTTSANGVLMITLNRPFSPLPNETVYLIPNCARTADDCKNKFNNYPRYGGCLFTPVGNPSLIDQSNGGSQGGKK